MLGSTNSVINLSGGEINLADYTLDNIADYEAKHETALILNYQSGGGQASSSYSYPKVFFIQPRGFYRARGTVVSFPSLTVVGSNAFYYTYAKSLELNNVVNVGACGFAHYSPVNGPNQLFLPKCNIVDMYAFNATSGLTRVTFDSNVAFKDNVFDNSSITELVLKYSGVISLSEQILANSNFVSGGSGKIYVSNNYYNTYIVRYPFLNGMIDTLSNLPNFG